MSSAPSHSRWVIFAGLDIMFGLLLGQNDLPHEDTVSISNLAESITGAVIISQTPYKKEPLSQSDRSSSKNLCRQEDQKTSERTPPTDLSGTAGNGSITQSALG